MKNTRRMIAAAMALAMVSALAPMGVFAEDKGMTVSYTYTPPAPTYTVSIPSGVTLSDSAAVEKSITAENVANMEANGKKIVVTLDAATNDNDTDTTFHAKNGDSDATYTITAGTTAVKVGDTVAEFTADGASALTFSKITLPASPVAGDYTETLTFGIALADTALPVPEMITITNKAYSGTANFTTTDGIVNVSFTNPSGKTFGNDGDNDGWYFYGANSTTTVTAAEGYTIDKVKFYTKAEAGTGVAEITSAPFTVYSADGYHTWTGPNGTGTDLGAWGVNKIEVYFK